MKERKVYVDELPKSCFDCPIIVEGPEGYDCCVCAFLVETAESKNRLKDCPLKSLHDHDKELVEKVFEKIKSKFNYYELVDEIREEIDFDKIKNYVLDQIQKEFEDERD